MAFTSKGRVPGNEIASQSTVLGFLSQYNPMEHTRPFQVSCSCRAELNWIRLQHGGSVTLETKSCYCRVARQALPCYAAVARLGVKRRATVVPRAELYSYIINTLEYIQVS